MRTSQRADVQESFFGTATFRCLFLSFQQHLARGTSMAMAHVSAVEKSANRLLLNSQEIEHLELMAGKAEKEQEMSNQIVKSLMMLTLVVGLTLAAAVTSANGQSTSVLVTADIPFDFIVADKTLPAGEYTVRMATTNGVKISSRDGESSAMRLSHLAVETSKKRNARIVFHRYGQQYFLAEIWSGESYGRQLLKSKKERHLRQEQELASNASKGGYEIVEVIAQVR
jgi:hypothetical protein